MVEYYEDCRSGGEVTTKRECEEAADDLDRNLSTDDLDLSFRVAFSSPSVGQRYCFWHPSGVYFNEDTSIAPSSPDGFWFRAICVKDRGEPLFK